MIKPTQQYEGIAMDTNNWHSDTIARFKTLPSEALIYIRDDAYTAAQAGETIDNPKTGQYWDEFHYASQELRRRGITLISFKS
jgi:hypothetical protein